jgi:hypothetical protein
MMAYRHYLRCKATGRFPDDEMVSSVAVECMLAEQDIDAARRRRERQEMIELIAIAGRRGS